MNTSIRFTASDLLVDGHPVPRTNDDKSNRQVVATAIKTALFGTKKKGKK